MLDQVKKTPFRAYLSRLYILHVSLGLAVTASVMTPFDTARAEEPAPIQIATLGTEAASVATVPARDEIPGDLPAAVYEEVHCLALNIYFEARGETATGQRAVAHVVMNRAAHPRFPSSVCEVVRQGGEKRLHRCQFSWWCDGQSDEPANRKAWLRALQLAQEIYAGMLPDITRGALWYHADYVTPYWSKVLLQGDKIGQHIFYLEDDPANSTL